MSKTSTLSANMPNLAMSNSVENVLGADEPLMSDQEDLDVPVYNDTTTSTNDGSKTLVVVDNLQQPSTSGHPNGKTSSMGSTFANIAKLWNKSTNSDQTTTKNNKEDSEMNQLPNGNGNAGHYPHIQYATIVTNVTFAYGRGKKAVNALNDITIKVPVGSIYGILGPSGCGKSTLVHCLVGSLKPKSGFVKVFGEVPGSYRSLVPGPGVGYMPQEIGLFNEFTIKETLLFFGRLYRLPISDINSRIAFLISFLELPDKSSLVSKLSGGQKRRVSLAAALVHRPPLLVLDEPTVGIDPCLRQSIWRHLRSLAQKDGITVIITTHYIEEARYANIVAFMRNGSLLEQGKPEELIKQFKLNNLEEVFLALCNNNNSNNGSSKTSSADEQNNEVSEDKPLLRKRITTTTETTETESNLNDQTEIKHNIEDRNDVTFSTTDADTAEVNDLQVLRLSSDDDHLSTSINIQTNRQQQHAPLSKNDSQPLAHRLLMKRNKLLDHFARSSALLTKNVIRMWRNLPVLIFTSLIPALQCTLFFLCLGRNPYDIPVSVFNGELKPAYSADFLTYIDNRTILLQPVLTFEEGFQTVKSGRSKALLSMGSNFSRALLERSIDLLAVDDETLKMSNVNLYLDMSSQFHANLIKQKVFKAYEEFARHLLLENNMNPKLADPPINIHPPILGTEDPTVTEFMAPGFILSLAFFASIATAALTLVLERKDGLLERSLVAGVYPNEYILSHVITQTVVVIMQTFSVLLIAFFIFEIPNIGPVFWISVLIVMQGVCGMAYGVLISAVAKEENFTLAACMGSMFPQFLLSGVVWPVETMPKFLIYISTFFSQAKSIEAVRYMLYRGWDPLHHFDVALGFIISASWTIVFLFIATILFNVHKS